jgi:signal peptidase I
MNDFRETIKTLIFALLFAFIFRSFVYEPFHIPSDSMKSNLLVGDYLFVSKFSYGYSRFSFPFFGWPHVSGRFLGSEPKRGDVIVFRPPGKPSEDFIKRLIGLPGDRIQMKGGILYINDRSVVKEYMDEWTDPEPDGVSGRPRTYRRYRETLPEGKSYLILNGKNYSAAEDTEEFIVPPEHYFMMGDNRDNSHDSRYLDNGDPLVGFVPAENLVGRADIIMLSWEGVLSFRPDRFFKVIP